MAKTLPSNDNLLSYLGERSDTMDLLGRAYTAEELIRMAASAEGEAKTFIKLVENMTFAQVYGICMKMLKSGSTDTDKLKEAAIMIYKRIFPKVQHNREGSAIDILEDLTTLMLAIFNVQFKFTKEADFAEEGNLQRLVRNDLKTVLVKDLNKEGDRFFFRTFKPTEKKNRFEIDLGTEFYVGLAVEEERNAALHSMPTKVIATEYEVEKYFPGDNKERVEFTYRIVWARNFVTSEYLSPITQRSKHGVACDDASLTIASLGAWLILRVYMESNSGKTWNVQAAREQDPDFDLIQDYRLVVVPRYQFNFLDDHDANDLIRAVQKHQRLSKQ